MQDLKGCLGENQIKQMKISVMVWQSLPMHKESV